MMVDLWLCSMIWSQRPLTNIANISEEGLFDQGCSFGGPFMMPPRSLCKTFKPTLSLTFWITGVKSWQLLRKTHVLSINMFWKLKDSDQVVWLDVVVKIISFFLSFDREIEKSSNTAFEQRLTKSAAFEVWLWVQKCEWVKFLELEAEFKKMPPLPHVIVSATRYNV